jgi:hypothetical protein
MDVKPEKEYKEVKYPSLNAVRASLRRNSRGTKAAVGTAMAVAAALSMTMCTPATTTANGDATGTSELEYGGATTTAETGTFETQLAGDLAVTETEPLITLSGLVATEESDVCTVPKDESTAAGTATETAATAAETTVGVTGDETYMTTAGVIAIEE